MSRSKADLRRILIETRRNMTAQEVRIKSGAIAEKLIHGVDWADIKTLHVYSSVPEWNEVRTGPIIEYVRAHWPKIRVTSPQSKPNPTPPSQKFNLIIVPCLGFDKELYRLGLGGGWYDRFLVNQPRALKIGLCFADGFIKHSLPYKPHDIPMDKIITETVIL